MLDRAGLRDVRRAFEHVGSESRTGAAREDSTAAFARRPARHQAHLQKRVYTRSISSSPRKTRSNDCSRSTSVTSTLLRQEQCRGCAGRTRAHNDDRHVDLLGVWCGDVHGRYLSHSDQLGGKAESSRMTHTGRRRAITEW